MVKAGTSCFFKDQGGVARFVEPPTESRSGGESGTDVRVLGPFG